jgi:hypothetical protein
MTAALTGVISLRSLWDHWCLRKYPLHKELQGSTAWTHIYRLQPVATCEIKFPDTSKSLAVQHLAKFNFSISFFWLFFSIWWNVSHVLCRSSLSLLFKYSKIRTNILENSILHVLD